MLNRCRVDGHGDTGHKVTLKKVFFLFAANGKMLKFKVCDACLNEGGKNYAVLHGGK